MPRLLQGNTNSTHIGCCSREASKNRETSRTSHVGVSPPVRCAKIPEKVSITVRLFLGEQCIHSSIAQRAIAFQDIPHLRHISNERRNRCHTVEPVERCRLKSVGSSRGKANTIRHDCQAAVLWPQSSEALHRRRGSEKRAFGETVAVHLSIKSDHQYGREERVSA